MSFFRYPGGKSKLRKEIVNKLSAQAAHKGLQYREPFFGGGSIGLKFLADSQHITKAWINDKDVGIACLWTSVIRYHEEFKERVKSFKPSVQAFHEIRSELIAQTAMPSQDKIIDIGFKKLAIHQISYSGLGTKSGGPLGGAKQESDYKVDCRWSPKYICKKIDKVHGFLGNLEIHENCCTNLDFSDLIKDNTCDSLLYLDPPYYIKGNDLYQHGFTVEDHKRLAVALKNTKHNWLLSYDDCQDIRDLYKWASLESLDVNYSITATKNKDTGKRLSRTKAELLMCPDRKGDCNGYLEAG